MKGRRIPVENPSINPSDVLKEAGDYCGPVMGWSGDKPAVFFLLPTARDLDAHGDARSIRHVVSPPHTFTEQPDGSLTIRDSIRSSHWHGYLTAGEWSVA